ncbi:MAG: hypothetical protein ACM3MI_14925 [Clostridiales bacterium]
MDLAKELSKRSDISIKNVFIFVASILLCEAAGLVGYLFTSPAIPTCKRGNAIRYSGLFILLIPCFLPYNKRQ